LTGAGVRRKLFRAAALTLATIALTGCASWIKPMDSAPAQVGYKSQISEALANLPEPDAKIVIGVYKFRDQTGQYKSGSPVVTYSTAVTQGATSMLIKALQDVGGGKWFSVVERESLTNLLNERKIIRQTREQYLSEDDKKMISPLPPLLYAPIMMDGGVIAYETNLLTGGLGARYLGIGGSTEFRRDTVTIYLRAVSVKNGEIFKSVLTNKTIFSMEVNTGVFKFVSLKDILEVEAGLSTNEPPQMAVLEAIEKAVYSMVLEGVVDGLWSFKNPREGEPFIKKYLQEKNANVMAEFDASGNLVRVSQAEPESGAVDMEKINNNIKAQKIQKEYNRTLALEKEAGTLEEKARLWRGFIDLYPANNPTLVQASGRLHAIERAAEIESLYASNKKYSESDAPAQEKISRWQTFLEKYPNNNPRQQDAAENIRALHRSQDIDKTFQALLNFEAGPEPLDKKAAAWQQFQNKYPDNNPYIEETNRRIDRLNQHLAEKQRTESREYQIGKNYAALQQLEKQGAAPGETLAAWQKFIDTYPDNNPHLDEAKARIQELNRSARIENSFAELKKLHSQDTPAENKISAWTAFIDTYPDNNTHLDEAKTRIQELKHVLNQQKPVIQSSAPQAEKAPESPAAPRQKTSAGARLIEVQPGDTLIKLAARLHSGSGSIEPMAVALWKNNRDKFIGGNMNGIRAGTFLRLDGMETHLAALDAESSRTIMVTQWQRWKNRHHEAAPDVQEVVVAAAVKPAPAPARAAEPMNEPVAQITVQPVATTTTAADTTVADTTANVAPKAQVRKLASEIRTTLKTYIDRVAALIS